MRFIVEFILLLSMSMFGVVFYPLIELLIIDAAGVSWSKAPIVVTIILNTIAYLVVRYFANKPPVFEFNLKR